LVLGGTTKERFEIFEEKENDFFQESAEFSSRN